MASNKRERELARMRAERQAARRAAQEAQHKQRRNTIVIALSATAVVAVVAVAAILIGTGGSDKKTTLASSPSSTPTPTPTTAEPGTCVYTKSGTSAKKISGTPPTTGVIHTGTRKAVITTSRGAIDVNLLAAEAPCTVNSFAYLAGQKYFDHTPCPRLVTTGIFVLQCGDPSGTTSGGPGYTFADENLQGATYPAGTLAMANSGPNTNGSQFFLVFKATQLPASYTPFGTISKGLDVLLTEAKGGDDGSNSAGGGKPKLPISLTKVTVA